MPKAQTNPTTKPTKSPKSTAERDAYTLDEFCRRHAISRGTFYNLKAVGKAPVEARAMGRVLITREAAEAWRRAREVESENA